MLLIFYVRGNNLKKKTPQNETRSTWQHQQQDTLGALTGLKKCGWYSVGHQDTRRGHNNVGPVLSGHPMAKTCTPSKRLQQLVHIYKQLA